MFKMLEEARLSGIYLTIAASSTASRPGLHKRKDCPRITRMNANPVSGERLCPVLHSDSPVLFPKTVFNFLGPRISLSVFFPLRFVGNFFTISDDQRRLVVQLLFNLKAAVAHGKSSQDPGDKVFPHQSPDP